jgi:thymidylate synthase
MKKLFQYLLQRERTIREKEFIKFCKYLLTVLSGPYSKNFKNLYLEYLNYKQQNKVEAELTSKQLTGVFKRFGLEYDYSNYPKEPVRHKITIDQVQKVIDVLSESQDVTSYTVISIAGKKYYLVSTLQPIEEESKPLWSREAKDKHIR